MGKRAPALRKQSHARLNVLKYIIYGMYLSGDTVSDIAAKSSSPMVRRQAVSQYALQLRSWLRVAVLHLRAASNTLVAGRGRRQRR